MSPRGACIAANDREADSFPTLDGVVEIPLLLPVWQAETLEELAHARRLTAAELVRQLLTEFIARATAR